MFPTQNFEQVVINAFFLHTYGTPSNLKIGLEVPKVYGKLENNIEGEWVTVKKNFDIFYWQLLGILPSHAEFVLKILRRHVPGLEAVQFSILR